LLLKEGGLTSLQKKQPENANDAAQQSRKGRRNEGGWHFYSKKTKKSRRVSRIEGSESSRRVGSPVGGEF